MLGHTFLGQPSFLWFGLKIFVFLFLFLWFRATFPRYRYDQIMRLGWKALIPVTIVWIGVEMVLAATTSARGRGPGITRSVPDGHESAQDPPAARAPQGHDGHRGACS